MKLPYGQTFKTNALWRSLSWVLVAPALLAQVATPPSPQVPADDAVQLVRHGDAVVGKVALDSVDVAAELIERLADSVEPGGLLAPEICRPAEQSGGYSWPEQGQQFNPER
jgi:hypothetical protein